MLQATALLKHDGLTGVQIARTWVECQVLPLQARAATLSDYRGSTDPSRVSAVDLEEKEIRRRLA